MLRSRCSWWAREERNRKMLTELAANGIKKVFGPALNTASVGVALADGLTRWNESERDDLTYARYEIETQGKIAKNLRLLFLCDLHEKEFGGGNRELLEMADAAKPDAVLIGGDMITAPRHMEDVLTQKPETDAEKPPMIQLGGNILSVEKTLSLCKNLAEKYPVFYAPGNHEQRIDFSRFADALRDYGVTYLSDESAEFENLKIHGLYIAERYYKAFRPDPMGVTYILSRVGSPDPEKFNILLAHSPYFTETYAESGMDLVLSGHFHGGTVRLPGNVGLMTPQYQFFSTKVEGIRQIGRGKMIISAGLGTHSFNIRIGNKPQVVVVDLKK